MAVGGGLAVIVVAALVLSMHGGSSSNTGAACDAGGTPTASAGEYLGPSTQQQAATALSGLLAQSGKDHADVNAAFSNVEACGKGLSHDAQVFATAASNRRTLLTKLAQLPGRAALPPAMISDLTTAWQASATVDADLAKWATDAAGHCRKGRYLNDPNYTRHLPLRQQGDQRQDRVRQDLEPPGEEERPAEDPADPALGTAAAPGNCRAPGAGAVALAGGDG